MLDLSQVTITPKDPLLFPRDYTCKFQVRFSLRCQLQTINRNLFYASMISIKQTKPECPFLSAWCIRQGYMLEYHRIPILCKDGDSRIVGISTRNDKSKQKVDAPNWSPLELLIYIFYKIKRSCFSSWKVTSRHCQIIAMLASGKVRLWVSNRINFQKPRKFRAWLPHFQTL